MRYQTEPTHSSRKPFAHELDGFPLLSGCCCARREEGADFRVVGTSTESMLGACEAFYKPSLNPDELFEVACQSMVSALGRDALSGWGALVHVMYDTCPSGQSLCHKTFRLRSLNSVSCVCLFLRSLQLARARYPNAHNPHAHGLIVMRLRCASKLRSSMRQHH